MGQWLLKKHKINNKTKNSRQFSSHALRYAFLIMCLRNLVSDWPNVQPRSIRPSNNEAGLCLLTSEMTELGIISR